MNKSKILAFLKSFFKTVLAHKKKSGLAIFLIASFLLWRKKQDYFDKGLEKMNTILLKELQKNLEQNEKIKKEFEALRKINTANLEILPEFLQSLNILFKKNFNLDELNKKIQIKNIPAEEKLTNWNSFKKEIFIYVVLVLISYRFFISCKYFAELIVARENEENGLGDFLSEIIVNGIIEFKLEILEKFQLDFERLNPKKEITQEEIIDFLEKIISYSVEFLPGVKEKGNNSADKDITLPRGICRFINNCFENWIGKGVAELANRYSVKEKTLEEVFDWVQSRNIQIYFYFIASYELEKFRNRLKIYFIKYNKNSKMVLASFLSILLRILKEEFLEENSEKINEEFYKNRVKLSLAGNEIGFNLKIVKEFEMWLKIKDSLEGIGKKIFFEKSVLEAIEEGDRGTEEREENDDKEDSLMKVLTQI